MLFTLLFLLSSPTSAAEESIQWPKAVDSFDEYLINLVKQYHHLENVNRRRRDISEDDDLLSPTTPTPKSTTAAPGNATVKNFTIDWNEVDKKWKEVISEEEVVKKWTAMETGLKNGIRSLLRTIFPQVVSMSSDAKVSGNCSAGILKWIISLRHLKGWAIKMFDAMGKPGAGMLEGSLTMFGNHRQCLDIRAPDDEDDFEEDVSIDEATGKPKFKEFFRGQYCMLELKPWLPKKPRFYGLEGGRSAIKALTRDPNDDTVFADMAKYASFLHFVAIRFDLCVPSICQREDLQRVANFIASKLDFRARVVRCEVRSDSFIDMTPIQVFALLSFVGVVGLVSTATTVVVLWPYVKRGSPPTLAKLLSINRAWNEFTGIELYMKKPKLASLYGLRYMIIMWIMFTEIVNVVGFPYLREMLPLKDLAISRGAHVITNSSLQYSSFIFVSAFIFGYFTEGKGLWACIKYLIKKYFRIAPVVSVGTGMMVLLPLLDHRFLKGPVWGDILNNRTATCQTTWWRNVFFIQNFFHPSDTCLPETWLLCVEIQLIGFFTFLMGFTSSLREKSRTIQWIILSVIVSAGFVANFLQVYFYDLPPSWYWTLPDPDQKYEYFHLHLYKPWTHLSAFAIGFAAGLLCVEKKKGGKSDADSHEIPYGKGVTRVIGWLFVAIVSAILIFGFHDWVLGDLPDPLIAGLFDGAHRIIWSVGHMIMLYLIVADMDEEFSISRSILGNKVVIYLGKLSLSAFISHPIVELLFFATQQTYIFSSPVTILYFVVGTLAFTYGIALFITIFFELPVAAIFKTRESTIVKEELFPKFNPHKPSTYHVNPVKATNGDIEMKGKEHQIRL